MKHPLLELRDRANKLEQEIISLKIGDTEALVEKVVALLFIVRGLISVGLAEVEPKVTTEEIER